MPDFSGRFESIELLDGEYVVFPDYKSAEALIAEVCYVRRNDTQKIYTSVAHLSAVADSGAIEGFYHPHWDVRLFVDSGVRYLADLKTTEVVSNPEYQAGPNKPVLEHLLALRDSELPYIHPDLPRALGLALIGSAACSEPLVVHVHVGNVQTQLSFGKVVDDDDENP